jgi:hypothetical protein
MPYRITILAFLSVTAPMAAQTDSTIAGHIIWEHDLPHLSADSASADHDGNLWIVSSSLNSHRLICISSNGETCADLPLTDSVKPKPPAEAFSSELATSVSGTLALLTHYMHADGKTIYFDGATFARLSSNGKLGAARQVAGEGPDYKGFAALTDGHFLVLGDQSPMVVINLSPDGNIAWRRTFSSSWVLPSAAALENGSSFIVTPDYKRAVLHLIWIDKDGGVRHREDLAGNRSAAAGYNGSSTLLYSRLAAGYRSDYFMTSFDRKFNRVWTVRVLDSAFSGGVYGFAAVTDGYVVAIQAEDGLFLAKYASMGALLWSAADTSREHADFIVPSGDGFYLIGAGPKGQYSLHVIRAR